MLDSTHYCFGPAKPGDAGEVFGLVYANPHPFLKRVELSDVEKWITADHSICWVAKEVSTNRIVAACNMNVPLPKPGKSPEPAEFGGLFIDENYRKRGVAEVLGVFALTSYFWDTDPDSSNPIALIAHVHVENPGPRPNLDRLGFRHTKRVQLPGDTPGFEHMPKDSDGFANGDEFEFPPERRAQLFRSMAGYLSTRELPVTREGIEFDTPTAMTAAALEELAAQLQTIGQT